MQRRSRSVALVFGVVVSGAAFGAVYEAPIHINDDDDLVALGDRGDISDDTLQTLRELLQDGVDLNTANRDDLYELPSLSYAEVDAIIEYRKVKGAPITEPTELVGAGAITADQLDQIAPFLLIAGTPGKFPLSGHYDLWGMYTATDTLAPPFRLQLTLRGPWGVSAGVAAVTSRKRFASPFYDPTTDTLEVLPAQYRLDVPKFFLQWKNSKVQVTAGTFRLGFGQRLTLDNTVRYSPTGIYADAALFWNRDLSRDCTLSALDVNAPCADSATDHYVTSDFIWRDGFRGLAASAEDLEIGESAKMSIYGFASYQTHNIYQYEIYDQRTCLDPRDDNDVQCKAPPVLVHDTGSVAPTTQLAFSTLQALWDELTIGGHADVQPTPRFSIGATGYVSIPQWHVPQMQLDFQEWSKYPFGGRFGAFGLDGRLTLGNWNLYLEASRSFDQRILGGGGWGVIERSVWSTRGREIEISARFYDDKMTNPYARPIAAPDELDGQRARNEAGVRIKYLDRTLGDLALRASADFWVLPFNNTQDGLSVGNNVGSGAGTSNLYALLRGDFKGWRFFQPSVWLDYRNKDLAHSGVGACYEETAPIVAGEPLLCTGELYRATVATRIAPFGNKLEVLLQYQMYLMSSLFYADRLMPGLRATAEISSRPIEKLTVRLRSRMYIQDLVTATRDERSLWTFMEVGYAIARPLVVTVRYDNYLWFDQRASTGRRTPNPEHRFRLELEGRF